jgi:hypothetical protein
MSDFEQFDADDFALFPEWKQAVKDFVEANFAPGTTIDRQWFLQRFGMTESPDAQMSAEKHQELQFKWLRNMSATRDALLQQHQIALESVTGIGYRVIPPHEQTDVAMRRMKKEMRSALAKAIDTVTYTKTEALTDEQRRARNDALAKLSMLRGMNRAALKSDVE